MTLDELRADLLTRWKAAFGRRPEVEAGAPEAAQTVYTQYPAYALSGWSKGKVRAGARVSRAPGRDGRDFVFLLDAAGRPLHVRYSHPVNHVDWQGSYRYRPEEVERLEFCMQTGVPNLYERLILSGDTVLAEQRFVCNGAGSDARLARLSHAEAIDAILNDPSAYFIYLTLYAVEDGVTRSAAEHHEVGGKVHRPTQEHIYSRDGKLERIVQHWPDGEKRTIFAAKTKSKSADLADALSAKLADAVSKRLREASFTAPLVAVELSYRLFDHHIPQIIPLTEADDVKGLALAAEIDASRWLSLPEEEFAPEITEFDQRAQASESGSAVSKMLRAAARRVTDRAPTELRAAEGFVAFAIDWEMEGDDLAKILKQCGATPKKLAAWRKKGWL